MKILSITAGAANMYCGSCLRDNALAAELITQGHDVVLLPFYTLPRTDEPSVSTRKIFFGGISIYLEHHLSLFRKTPWLLDRLWDSPRVIQFFARRNIKTHPRMLGALTVSTLEGAGGPHRKELMKLLRWLESEPAPDAVSLPYTLLISLAAPLKQALGRPVCCALQGEDLFLEGLLEPYRSRALELIRSQVENVDAFLAVSDYYAEFMARYLHIPDSKIRVVPLGINLQGHEPVRRRDPHEYTIGYLARIAPEKGLHVLCEAYRLLRQTKELPPSRLEVAGYLAPEFQGYLAEIRRRMSDWGLDGDFHYRGALDRPQKIGFLQKLDVLSVPCTYDEPKGMFLLEAMANGVPVVQPRRGSFPEILARTGGGILVEPDDPDSLAEGLLSVWRDPTLALRLSTAGPEGVRRHYNVSQMAERALEVFQALADQTFPAAVKQG